MKKIFIKNNNLLIFGNMLLSFITLYFASVFSNYFWHHALFNFVDGEFKADAIKMSRFSSFFFYYTFIPFIIIIVFKVFEYRLFKRKDNRYFLLLKIESILALIAILIFIIFSIYFVIKFGYRV